MSGSTSPSIYAPYSANGDFDIDTEWYPFEQSPWDQAWHMVAQQNSQQQQVSLDEPFQTNIWPTVAACHTNPGTFFGGNIDSVESQCTIQYECSDAYEISPVAGAVFDDQQMPRSLDPRVLRLRAMQAGLDNRRGGSVDIRSPTSPTAFTQRPMEGEGVAALHDGSKLFTALGGASEQAGQSDEGHRQLPRQRAILRPWTSGEGSVVRAFVSNDRLSSWDRIGGIMHRAGFPERSALEYAEHHHALRAAKRCGRCATGPGLGRRGRASRTPWTVEEENYFFTNAIPIDRRSIVHRVRDEMPRHGYGQRSIGEYIRWFDQTSCGTEDITSDPLRFDGVDTHAATPSFET